MYCFSSTGRGAILYGSALRGVRKGRGKLLSRFGVDGALLLVNVRKTPIEDLLNVILAASFINEVLRGTILLNGLKDIERRLDVADSHGC